MKKTLLLPILARAHKTRVRSLGVFTKTAWTFGLLYVRLRKNYGAALKLLYCSTESIFGVTSDSKSIQLCQIFDYLCKTSYNDVLECLAPTFFGNKKKKGSGPMLWCAKAETVKYRFRQKKQTRERKEKNVFLPEINAYHCAKIWGVYRRLRKHNRETFHQFLSVNLIEKNNVVFYEKRVTAAGRA